MNKTVYKTYSRCNFVKEELWLNKMASQGWVLTYVGFFSYYFEKTEPNEYIVRLQYLEKGCVHPDSLKYIMFIKEMGANYIYYSKDNTTKVYFSKKAKDGEFNLISDSKSLIKVYENSISYSLSGLILFLYHFFRYINFSYSWLLLFVFTINISGIIIFTRDLILSIKRRHILKKEINLYE